MAPILKAGAQGRPWSVGGHTKTCFAGDLGEENNAFLKPEGYHWDKPAWKTLMITRGSESQDASRGPSLPLSPGNSLGMYLPDWACVSACSVLTSMQEALGLSPITAKNHTQ